MSLQLGDIAPDFHAKTSKGDIDFYDYVGDNWVILFSHPGDYTPVCTTELGRTAALQGEFDKRGVKVLALSVDEVDDHHGWIKDINSTQNVNVDYPIIADADLNVSNLYGMIHPNASSTHTVRSVYIIDPAKKVRLTLTYPASTGRNFTEILRVIDSLQLTDKHPLATPVEWEPGDDCIVALSVDTKDIPEKFPKGFKEITSYLRTTPQPD